MPATMEQQLARVADRLVDDFAGRVPEDVIRKHVRSALEEIGSPRVTTFVPVLVDRSVRDRIRQG